MASSNTARRQITNLSEPLQIRELNRQLEWIWQQLLGGLTMKSLSEDGVDQATELIIETTSEIYDSQIEDIEDDLEGVTGRVETLENSLVYPKSIPE